LADVAKLLVRETTAAGPRPIRVPVRATKAYLAGFGTAGSLVAGAALLFLVGSAIVAFRGWPQIGGAPATTVVAAQLSPPSHVTQRLAAVLRRRTRASGHLGSAGEITTQSRGVYTSRPQSSGGGASIGAGGTSAAPAAGVAAPISAASSAPSGCASTCNQPASGGVITHVTNAVSQAVSTVGAGVGQQISQASSGVASTVSGTSSQVAGAVAGAGSSAGSAVSGTANAAGGAVSQVGSSGVAGH